MSIKITSSNINVTTFEEILFKINLYLHNFPKRNNIYIDMSNSQFMDPYSIVNFTLLLRYLNNFFADISIKLPCNDNVNSYLERMNFFNNIHKKIQILNKPVLSKRRFSDSDVLLELTAIKQQSDVYKVIDYSVTKIGKILKASLDYKEEDLSSFCTALCETCQNIIDHSNDWGFVSVQKYHSNNNYVIISVSDLGIGVKRSLSCRYDVRSLGHKDAIRKALQPGISRFYDRGKGLYRVIEIIKKYNGRMTIRSGSGCVKIYNNIQSSIVNYFPGTQIYIRL